MKKYTEIISKQPEMINCFFAFSIDQYHEAIKKHNLEGKKIYRAYGGLFGTKEGIINFNNFYNNQVAEIVANCDPQEIYDYEFNNYECDYICDDTEAFKIVSCYFGENVKIKRRFNY